MLVSLHVKDLALIEETEVLWKEGLNIITGETGAGKSVIIGSIRLALGAAMSSVLGSKGDRDCIRTGADYALVELVFSTKKESIISKLEELDLPVESDGTIFIQRKIMPGRSVCKVNGETTSGKQLKELASLLIDIHGQHDTQTLLNVKKHSAILDEFAGADITEKKNQLKLAYKEYDRLRKELQRATADLEDRDKEISLAEFEVNEIENARLEIGEDEKLEERFRIMNNSRKIVEGIGRVSFALGSESESGAMNGVSYALREIKSVASYDQELESIEEQIATIDDLLADVNRSVSDYLDHIQFSQEEYIETEERLNIYNHLKNKYGSSVEEIFTYLEKQQEKLSKLVDYEGYIESLHMDVDAAEKLVISLSGELSQLRKNAAVILSEKMQEALTELNFANVDFDVCVTSDEERRSEDGFDEVEFMISLNPGEPRKPMNLVASGGELSRIMLALKTIMADGEQIETLIFDEIDSGISGRTAWKVSEKMAVLGRAHQLICITHLPQIAAMADSHYVIEKSLDETKAVTDIHSLNEKEQLEEIARLLGSDTITDAAIANAVELKNMAKQTKAY